MALHANGWGGYSIANGSCGGVLGKPQLGLAHGGMRRIEKGIRGLILKNYAITVLLPDNHPDDDAGL